MIRLIAMTALCGALSGCVAAPALVIYEGAKTESRAHTARVMAKLRTDLDANAAGDCVFNNMERREILKMGTSDVTGISQAHLDTVRAVIARPATAACLANLPATAA